MQLPDDAWRHIASFMDGKTAQRSARVSRVLAEQARLHEDITPEVTLTEGVERYVEKYLSRPEVALNLLYLEFFGSDGESDLEDGELPALDGESDLEDGELPALVCAC